jgi:cation:H+ antiporter
MTILAGVVLGTAVASSPATEAPARVPRIAGIVLMAMLPVYLYLTFRRREVRSPAALAGGGDSQAQEGHGGAATLIVTLLKVIVGTLFVVVASRILLPIVVELSRRAGLPESFIAATLVAVGTSLPELSTSIAAARKGELELGLGNVAGANIMNVLLVVGLSAVVSPTGLEVDRYLLTQMIPAAFVLCGALALFLVRGRGARVVGAALMIAYVALVAVGLAGV